jgi:hypothetical protein
MGSGWTAPSRSGHGQHDADTPRGRTSAPVRLVLGRRTLEDPVHDQCGVCFETRRLQQSVVLGADELAICRDCYEAAARFSRLGRGHPIMFDLEQLP